MRKGWECSACGSATTSMLRGSYAYKESGLEHITLEGIDLIHCEDCNNEDPIIPALDTLHDLLADALISKPGRLSGKEFRFLRKYLELSSRELASVLHIDHTTISKWENDQQPIGAQSDLLIRALVQAGREGGMDKLVQKLKVFTEEISALDIILDMQNNHFEFA